MYGVERFTHKCEKCIDVVRDVLNHALIVFSNIVLDSIPGFQLGIWLRKMRSERHSHDLIDRTTSRPCVGDSEGILPHARSLTATQDVGCKTERSFVGKERSCQWRSTHERVEPGNPERLIWRAPWRCLACKVLSEKSFHHGCSLDRLPYGNEGGASNDVAFP